MRLIIDLDGTICTEEKTYSRSLAKPFKNAVISINALYAQGHTIIIYSARSWQEYEMTSKWLKTYGIKYHQLILGKPIGDLWIDDRSLRYDGWNKMIKKIEAYKRKKN
jgi:haloacid dehalogenase-like hydrolase.